MGFDANRFSQNEFKSTANDSKLKKKTTKEKILKKIAHSKGKQEMSTGGMKRVSGQELPKAVRSFLQLGKNTKIASK